MSPDVRVALTCIVGSIAIGLEAAVLARLDRNGRKRGDVPPDRDLGVFERQPERSTEHLMRALEQHGRIILEQERRRSLDRTEED